MAAGSLSVWTRTQGNHQRQGMDQRPSAGALANASRTHQVPPLGSTMCRGNIGANQHRGHGKLQHWVHIEIPVP